MVILRTHNIILNLIIEEKVIFLRPKSLLIWTYGDLAGADKLQHLIWLAGRDYRKNPSWRFHWSISLR